MKDPVWLSNITGVPVDIITDLHDLYIALASPLPLCPVKIKEFCSIKEKNFGKRILTYSLIFDRKDGVSYCQIAKVASSTWCDHFIKLGR